MTVLKTIVISYSHELRFMKSKTYFGFLSHRMWVIMVGLVKNTKIASIYQYSKPKAYCLLGETWSIRGVDTHRIPIQHSYLACAGERWILKNNSRLLIKEWDEESNCRCYLRCGFFAGEKQHISWHLMWCSPSPPIFCRGPYQEIDFSRQGQKVTFIVLPQDYINSPVLCQNLISGEFDHFSKPQGITLMISCWLNMISRM